MGRQTLVTSKDHPHLGGNILEGDFATYEPEMWQWLLDRFKFKTVLDVGCGGGYSTRWFHDQGCKATGLDGLRENVEATCDRVPGPHLLCDLSKPLPVVADVDMVWCCEVVEHIQEKHLDNLLAVLTRGKLLAMTHAGVGQGGWHHVNCKPEQYWIQHLESVGMKLLPVETQAGRLLCDPSHHFAQRGLIFGKVEA